MTTSYGSHTANVSALLRRAASLSPREAIRLAELYRAPARGRARAELTARGNARGREAARAAAAAVNEALSGAALSPLLRESAVAAVACAAMAVAARDVLAPDQYIALYSPWSQAMGAWYQQAVA